MSFLIVRIDARSRLHARSQGAGSPAADPRPGPGVEYTYAVSPDGLALQGQGQCAASLLPKADTVIAVLADADVGWHRITLPKAPAARLRAAITGVIEEGLLDDAETTHLAVAPQASAGEPTWIAAVNKAWLVSELAALERADVFVDRVAPSSWPDDPPTGHFSDDNSINSGDPSDPSSGVSLTWSHPDGVATLSLQGSLARAVFKPELTTAARFSASPGAASAAEQWLGAPVNVMSSAQRALQASRTLWDLRQFDLARRNRGTRALRDSLKKFFSPSWRPVRWGLIATALFNVLGLNLWAWHQESQIAARRAAMTGVLQTTFPQVRAVLDAPLQMQREVQTLRAAAGKAGDTDLEPMLQAAASAWPNGRPPIDAMSFEAGRLTLPGTGWSDAQIVEFRDRLRPGGWTVDSTGGKLSLTRTVLAGGAT
ncbi:MAG: general secretion pathway protein GspL [Pseudorhodobacter sp.]|nr:general secretion pathway protein GspL [Rhizobacter sp.]